MRDRLNFRTSFLMKDFSRDPWADHDTLAKETPPLSDGSEIRFLILGAGHNGILFAYQLVAAEFNPADVVVIDKAGGFGGTWAIATCHSSKKQDSFQNIATGRVKRSVRTLSRLQKYGIQGMFYTKAKSAERSDVQKRWVVAMSRNMGPKYQHLNGDFVIQTQFLMPAGSLFYSPSAPDVPGLGVFAENREIFHTSCSQAGQMAKWPKQLYVFQRTPSYCGPRKQVKTTPEIWIIVVGRPSWQADRMRNLNKFLNDHPEVTPADDLVKDGWSNARTFAGLIGSPRVTDVTPENVHRHLQRMLELDAEISTELRKHVEREVDDTELAEKLITWYPGWCKRPTFHQDYLKSFNRSNVTLVDTDEYFSRKGDLVKEYEVDVLVLATGFATTTAVDGDPAQVLNMPTQGRNGRDLTEKWQSDEFATFMGVATRDFSNLLFYTSKGATSSTNTTYPCTVGGRLVAHIAKTAYDRASDINRVEVEVSKEAE
ncbi:hypothetical protein BDP81DRAFT_451425 [Colletotrichum phormii]|uniref:Uncharacterized protein n=1 Tax=Colletotrichum phormii TaxID=359342 RepID=A0AAI9ZQ27_9PEZI|nr:uncharacterized protein BDP81DRAFT_451425 [Colletotrichum phormii]KAK1634953.1 hypothetical protein BDP81DRAFT_451425 [Colletotrichum phormii]